MLTFKYVLLGLGLPCNKKANNSTPLNGPRPSSPPVVFLDLPDGTTELDTDTPTFVTCPSMSDYVPSRQQFLWCFRLFSIVSSTRSASPPTVPSTEIVNGHPGSSNRCRGSTLVREMSHPRAWSDKPRRPTGLTDPNKQHGFIRLLSSPSPRSSPSPPHHRARSLVPPGWVPLPVSVSPASVATSELVLSLAVLSVLASCSNSFSYPSQVGIGCN
ncbi:hypothetical protein EV401DRAFT_934141 [Pisolithus croceorrhizus]|nr:hypothetical protein EV401DRAFT_934141 [Pisolithus croceorrhizus]